LSAPVVSDLDRLIQLLARIPGLGPRSARRAALQMIRRREVLMLPLAEALTRVAETIRACSICNNLDTDDPCAICRDSRRDTSIICVVAQVGDLWAIERSGAFQGSYHVLGGTLSALDGVGPDRLAIGALLRRLEEGKVAEVILALSATVDGQTTAHYLADRIAPSGTKLTRLAHGVPVGGELDYLDDGTLMAALSARRGVSGS
jgi:recombination protein RecR